jgi:hypothetical protein
MRLLRPIPDHITAHNEKDVTWRNGSRSPISNGRSGRTFDQMLDDPDIKDHSSQSPTRSALRSKSPL